MTREPPGGVPPTLLEHIEAELAYSRENFDRPCVLGVDCDDVDCLRLSRLRAAAARLRSEMERAAGRRQSFQGSGSWVCELLERINGGPLVAGLTGGEGGPASSSGRDES